MERQVYHGGILQIMNKNQQLTIVFIYTTLIDWVIIEICCENRHRIHIQIINIKLPFTQIHVGGVILHSIVHIMFEPSLLEHEYILHGFSAHVVQTSCGPHIWVAHVLPAKTYNDDDDMKSIFFNQ